MMLPDSGQHSSDNGQRQEAPVVSGGEAAAFWLCLLYMAGKASFFAWRINELVFPDEVSWFGIARVFSRARWWPVDSPESYPFGLVTHVPGLYFFLMGKLLTLNVFGVSDLLFLRLANVGLGLLTVAFAWRLICLLSDLVAVRLLFLTLVTNTLMFTFLFGAVSYDNLTNLLAVVSIYYACRFAVQRQGMALAYALLATLAGCLTKVTFLPLAALLAMGLLWRERHQLPELPARLKGLVVARPRPWPLVVVLAIVVLAGAGGKLYGGNWWRYGQLNPSEDQVLGLDQALEYRIFTRNYALNNYKAGKLSLLDAQRLALRIREQSDREATLELLEMARAEKEQPAAVPPKIGRLRYALVWGDEVLRRSFGIMAHKNMLKQGRLAMAPYYGLLAIALLGGLMAAKGRRPAWVADSRSAPLGGACGRGLFLLSAGYLVILMQVVNYQIYQATGVQDLALQGRYVFPVLIPAYVLAAHYFVVAWPPRLRVWSVAVLGIFLLYGEFPWFLRQVSPDWFFSPN